MGVEISSCAMVSQLSQGLLLLVSLASLASLSQTVSGCNEAVCASIVSKCMLLQSCKCDLHPDCTCCKKCFECLDYLYSECCSCVDMCPKPNVTIHQLSKKSHVEDLEENIPTLFQALTDQEDAQGRWSIVTFPVDIDMSAFLPVNTKIVPVDSEQVDHVVDPGKVTVNCSVA